MKSSSIRVILSICIGFLMAVRCATSSEALTPISAVVSVELDALQLQKPSELNLGREDYWQGYDNLMQVLARGYWRDLGVAEARELRKAKNLRDVRFISLTGRVTKEFAEELKDACISMYVFTGAAVEDDVAMTLASRGADVFVQFNNGKEEETLHYHAGVRKIVEKLPAWGHPHVLSQRPRILPHCIVAPVPNNK